MGISSGRGVLIATIFNAMYEAKLEIPVEEPKPKSNPMREGSEGMDIFRITYVFLLHSLPVKYESIKKLLLLYSEALEPTGS